MTLNIKNFVKYIICLGVIYGALKISKQDQLDRKTILIILVSVLIVMMLSDNFFKKEGMVNIWDQASQLDNIDLSFDSPKSESESESKLEKLIKETSEEEELQLIKITESESEESDVKAISRTVVTTKGNARVTSLDNNSKPLIVSNTNVVTSSIPKKTKTKSVSNEIKLQPVKKTESNDMSLDLNEKMDCSIEIAKMKRKLESELRSVRKDLMISKDQLNRNKYSQAYLNMLVKTLKNRGVLDKNDISNLNAKIQSKLLTVADIIDSLEQLMENGKVKTTRSAPESDTKFSDTKKHDIMKYSERPTKSYEPIGEGVDKWANDYTILNTEKWQIPMTRPPVCISTGNCKVCPSTTNGYPVALKEWDNSRKVTNMKINKKWANDQIDSGDEAILISES